MKLRGFFPDSANRRPLSTSVPVDNYIQFFTFQEKVTAGIEISRCGELGSYGKSRKLKENNAAERLRILQDIKSYYGKMQPDAIFRNKAFTAVRIKYSKDYSTA